MKKTEKNIFLTLISVFAFLSLAPITFAAVLTVPDGGTGVGSFLQGGILTGNSTSSISATYSPTVTSLNATSTSVASYFLAKFGVGTTSPFAKLSVKADGTGTNSAFVVANGNGSTTLTVLENGKIGIGITPTDPLHIFGSTDQMLNVSSSNSQPYIYVNSTLFSSYALLGTRSTGAFFQHASGSALRVEEQYGGLGNLHIGKLGVNTASPATTVDVSGLIRAYQTSTTTCSTTIEGAFFYSSANKHFWGCNGTVWKQLDN